MQIAKPSADPVRSLQPTVCRQNGRSGVSGCKLSSAFHPQFPLPKKFDVKKNFC
jgi:hypothetical protein